MQSVHKKISWLLTFVLLSVVAIALFAFQPQEMIRDSAYWARLVETRDPNIWHPHHLIYMPINLVILEGLSFFCSSCNAIDAGQIHSAVWAFVTVLCMQAMVFRFTGKPFIAFSFALLIATSQMPWVFAMQPQAYTPLIGSLSLLLAYMFRTKSDLYSHGWGLLVAVLYGLTVLYHQAMVLISLPLAYYVYQIKKPHGVTAATLVLFVSGAAVLLLYVWAAAYVKGGVSARSFYEYLTFFGQVMADPTYFSFENYKIHNVLALLNSQMNVIQVPVWKIKGLLLAMFGAGLVSVTMWNLRQIVVKAPLYEERTLLLVVLLIFWLLTLWGNPEDDGWPTFILIPIFLLAAASLADLKVFFERYQGVRFLFGVVLIVTISLGAFRNFNERVLPMHMDRGEDYRKAELISAIVPKECTIYESKMLVYYNLDYFFSRTIRDFWDIITAAYYGSARQRAVYFDYPDQSQCVALDVRYLHPLYRVSGKTAFDLPEEWAALVGWIFDIEETSSGLFQWREIRTARTSRGQSYVIISRDRRGEPLPINHFWRALASASANDERDSVDAHADWLRHACEGKKLQSYFGSLCALEAVETQSLRTRLAYRSDP